VKAISDFVQQNGIGLLSRVHDRLLGGTVHNLMSLARASVLVVK
jgi:hypothetical protein